MTKSERHLIQFALTPIDLIHPWGSVDAPNQHWYGLSDGSYWLELGGVELFRFSDSFLKRDPDVPGPPLPYVDYYVVRLHEDLLEMLPTILEPVPADLADLVRDPDEVEEFRRVMDRWDEQHDGDEAMEIYFQAVSWWGERRLNAGYLVCPPRIDIWRVDDTIHLRWDNREHIDDGIPVWSAQAGEVRMPADDFLAAVRSFDARFMAAMRYRVAEAVRDWPHPGVAIDLKALQAEQMERERALMAVLVRGPRQSDWATIRRAIAIVRAS